MEIKDEIIGIIAEEISIDESDITTRHHLVNDLGTDSLDTIKIMIAIEEKYNINIDDSDIENIKTVSDIVDIVKEQIGRKT